MQKTNRKTKERSVTPAKEEKTVLQMINEYHTAR